MAEINKQQSEIYNYSLVKDLYSQGTENPLIGTEIESWIVHTPAGLDLRAQMMSPDDSQALLSKLASAADAIVFSEIEGVRKNGKIAGAPIVCVESGQIAYQLELSGVLEAATMPFKLSEINSLLRTTRLGQQKMAKVAEEHDLVLYPVSILGSASVQDCEDNMVNRERLRSEWEKFKSYGQNSPGLRTMGLAASVQVSVGYRDTAELREIMQLSYLLSPLLTAAFANSSGFVEGEKKNELSRPRWWLEHNQYAPRGGIPPFMIDVMFNSKEDIIDGWLNHVVTTPMVYSYDVNGKAVFDSSPTFNELKSNGLGTMANFYLAESLLWPDVKLIGGKRVELRMCDSGPWQAEALTVIVAALLADPAGRAQLKEFFQSIDLSADEYITARENVSLEGLNTFFGQATLRQLLPDVLSLAINRAIELGIEDTYLESLKILRNTKTSDFEKWCSLDFSTAADADTYICQQAPSWVSKSIPLEAGDSRGDIANTPVRPVIQPEEKLSFESNAL